MLTTERPRTITDLLQLLRTSIRKDPDKAIAIVDCLTEKYSAPSVPYIIEFRCYDSQHGIVIDSQQWDVPGPLVGDVEAIARMAADGMGATVEAVSQVPNIQEF